MYVDERAIALVAEHRYDLSKLAEQERLLSHGRAGIDRRRSFRCRMIAGLGRRLARWGQHLTEHYGSAEPMQPLRPANSLR